MGKRPHMTVEVQRVADAVKALALHDFSACRGKEALVLTGIGAVQEIGDHIVDDCVAQEFQALIVEWLTLLVASANAFVHQCLTVILDVVRIETQYLVESRKKLLILAERELHSVNKFINPHIF